jgi:2,4'-dihydroxyacetophenone dioxygenase
MPEAPGNEFWRDLKPIVNPYKPDTKPEVFHQFAPIDDERYYIPLSETVGSRPLWISPSDNRWADVLWARSAGLVNRHYHPHEVFAYTISGKWGYLEQPWTASHGSFVYETPGESHTLVAYESDEPMRAFFVVTGPLAWLDEDGNSTGLFDVHDYVALAREHYDNVGLGSELIDALIR